MTFRRRRLSDRVQAAIDEMLFLLSHDTITAGHGGSTLPVQVARLEERLLMSASPVAIIADAAITSDPGCGTQQEAAQDRSDIFPEVHESESPVVADCEALSEGIPAALLLEHEQPWDDEIAPGQSAWEETRSPGAGTELIIIDAGVEEADEILSALLAEDRPARLLRLSGDEDGVKQITERLRELGSVSSVHLISHGSPGELRFGTTVLNYENLADRQDELAEWRTWLTEDADLQIYGCSVADGPAGQNFLAAVADVTGADVAGSTDLTGHADLGGDWDLEFQIGKLEQGTPFRSDALNQWRHSLATVVVDTTDDTVNGDTSSISALLTNKGADGRISLREAIRAANSTAGLDTIAFEIASAPISGLHTIVLNSAMDAVTDRIVIDGTTDSHFLTVPVIAINGSSAGPAADGLVLGSSSGGSTVRGLMIQQFSGYGIRADSGNNILIGNQIGTNSAGASLGNAAGGILISQSGNRVGGTTASEANIIAHNFGSGVSIVGGAANNSVLSNQIYSNTGRSIDLDGDGVTANDAEDVDGGSNARLNTAVISGVSVSGSTLTISGTTDLTSGNYRVEFFFSSSADISGGGEAKQFLGSSALLSSGTAGNEAFAVTLTDVVLPSSGFLSATVTEDLAGTWGNTSELSSAFLTGSSSLTGKSESAAAPVSSNAQETSAVDRGSHQAIAADVFGNYAVVWSEEVADGNGWGVFAQRFSSAGTAIGAAFRVNTVTSSDQQYASIAMNAAGHFVISWTSQNQDSDGEGVYLRRFLADGTSIDAADVLVNAGNTTGDQSNPSIAMNDWGTIVIAWQSSGSTTDIFARQSSLAESISGNALSSPLILVDSGANRLNPSVDLNNDGKFVIGWQKDKKPFLQRFNADGTARGSAIDLNPLNFLGGTEIHPVVGMQSNGSFFVAYQSQINGFEGLWLRQYNDNGTATGLAQSVAAGSQYHAPSVSVGRDNKLTIVYEGSDADGSGVYLRRFTATGTAIPGQVTVNQSTDSNQTMASVAAIDGLSAIVVWSGNGTLPGSVDSSGVFTRQFINTAPTLSGISGQTISEDSATGSISFTVGDAETSPASLTLTGASGNPALLSDSGIVISGSGSTRTVTVTPKPNQSGTVAITLTASDGILSTSTSFVLNVVSVPDPTLAMNDNYTVQEDSGLTVTAASGLLNNDTDADGQPLVVLDHTLPANGTVNVSSDGSLTYTPSANFNGTDGFQYVTTDASDELSHYWKLDGNAVDAMGSATGTISGAVSTQGHFNQALQFDGVNDYATIPDFTYSNDFTLSFWFRTPSNSGTGFQYLYSHGLTSDVQNRLHIFLIEDSATGTSADNTLRTRISDINDADNLSGLDVNVATLGLADNNWHQYTLAVKSGAGSTVYIDGIQRAQITSGGDSMNPNGAAFLASRTDQLADRFLSGSLDAVAFYSRALSSTEISQQFLGTANTGTVTISVNGVNDPPVLTTNSTGSITEGGYLPVTQSHLRVTDWDNLPSEIVYRLSGTPVNGELRLNGTALASGGTWTQQDIDTGKLTFVHDGSETSTASVTFSIQDGSGGTIPSATWNLTVSPVNDAPVLTPQFPSLGAINRGQTSSPMTVNSILGGSVSDSDPGSQNGMAVTGASGSGTWQYATNGNNWTNVGSVSTSSALLLSGSDRLRYVSSSTVESPTLSYAAWDSSGSTTGLSGARFDMTSTGTGSVSPFSATTDSAMLAVGGNLAPSGNSDEYQMAEDSVLTSTLSGGWYNGQWSERRRIVFNNSSGTANLTGQAVLVTLNSGNIDYGKVQNQGQDLRFIDPDGTELAYEIEEWNEAGTSRVWVQVPQIDAMSSTDFVWMYYGNTAAPAGQSPSLVWGSHQAVLHMNGPLTDSSPNMLSVTSTSVTDSSGFISGAKTFNGLTSEVQLQSSSSVDDLFAGGGTVSAWINPTGWGENNYGRIADKASSTMAGSLLGNGWALQLTTSGSILFQQGFTTTTGTWQTSGGLIALNSWTHVAVVYDSSSLTSNPQIYINGSLVSVTEQSTPVGIALSDSGQNLTVGNFATSPDRTFAGRIDEFRASSTAQTAAQIQAEYRSGSGVLATVGTAESGPGGVLSNDTDPELQPLTASLATSPTHAASFSLNSDGTFTYTPNPNFSGTDTFTYNVSDGTNTVSSVPVLIHIQNTNDAPVLSIAATDVMGRQAGAIAGSVTVTDPDVGDSFSIAVSDSRFEVVGGQLKLKAGIQIDPIAEPSVSLTITATDPAGATETRGVLLSVTDPNLPPTIALSNVVGNLAENTVVATDLRVADLLITDDAFGSNTISLTGADAAAFTVIGQSLYLRSGTLLDFESRPTFSITVNADDPLAGGFPDSSVTYTLSINNLNEAPSFTVAQTAGSISESVSTTLPIVIGTLTITDDALGTEFFTLSGADAAKFEIIGSQLRLKAGAGLDYETQTLLNVTINLDDSAVGATPDASAVVSVVITDVNEAPVADAGGSYTITEGGGLTVSGGLSMDPEGSVLTYQWDIDNDGQFDDATGSTAALSWSALGSLSLPVNDHGFRTIRLQVTDAAGLTATSTATLTILNAAPLITAVGAPTAVSGSPWSLSLNATDPGDDTLMEWIINWGDGVVERLPGSLTTASHTYLVPGGTRTVVVSGSDEDGTFGMTGGSLTVAVQNTAPSAPALDNLVIPANTWGARVGQVTSADPDFGDSLTWTVSDNRFEVQGNQLKLKAGFRLDPVSEPQVTVTVTATDAGGALASSNFILSVNHKPQASADFYAVDGTQQLSVASPSAGVLANDSDADGHPFAASLVSGPSRAAAFGLNSDGTFWYRPQSGYSGMDSFSYRVQDAWNSGNITAVSLAVNQPAALQYLPAISSVDDGTALSSRLLIGEIRILDDAFGTNSLTLTGADAAAFELDGSNRLYLRSGLTFDFESKASYSVIVECNDPAIAGSPDATRTVTIAVRNVNDRPVSSPIQPVAAAEDAGIQTFSVASAFHDPDSDPLRFSLQVLTQTPGLLQHVTIDPATGIVSYATQLNANGSAIVRVRATDPSGMFAAEDVGITIQPINDAPATGPWSGYTFVNVPLTVGVPGLGTSVKDPDNSMLAFTLNSAPANGTATVNADGSFQYTPAAGYTGTDTFSYIVSDGSLSGSGIIVVRVIPLAGPKPTGSGSGVSGTDQGVPNSSSTDSGSSQTSEGSSTVAENTSQDSTISPTQTSMRPENSGPLLNPAIDISSTAVPEDSSDNDDDEFIPMTLAGRGTVRSTDPGALRVEQSAEDSRREIQPETRDSAIRTTTYFTDSYVPGMSAGRDEVYQTLAAQAQQANIEFEQQLSQTTSFHSRVVGSVGVVTTGFSVGYLMWAVRGGMLLSGLLAQMPAWTMLDPLLVMDEDRPSDDRESLQSILDRQQRRLRSTSRRHEAGGSGDHGIKRADP